MQLSQIEMFEIVRCEFLNFPSSSLALDLFSYISRYCACFAAKTVCCPTCNCVNCANTVTNIYERQDAVKQILDRNPTAFESKFKNVSLQFLFLDFYLPHLSHRVSRTLPTRLAADVGSLSA
jgi:hypothetical protein